MRRLLFGACIVALAAGMAAAQATPSVFIYQSSQGGQSADWAAATLEGTILSDLAKQYPCVDLNDMLGVQAMIDLERMRDMLGAEPSQEQLAQFGGAIGARYVVTVKTIQMPNGSVYMSVTVIDTVTAKMVAATDSPPVGQNSREAAIHALSDKVLGDMASFLKGKCDEHWTGLLTFKYRKKVSGPSEKVIPPTTVDVSETTVDDTNMVLAPMSLGSTNPWHPGVKVRRHFEYHLFKKAETPVQERCRPRGANSYLRPTKSSQTWKKDESGDASAVAALYVDIRPDGTFVITINKNIDLKTTWTREDTNQLTRGCEDPPPIVATSTGEDTWPPKFLGIYGELRGKFDPKDPDVLKGSITEGSEETGVTSITWDLKRVRPKSRLQK